MLSKIQKSILYELGRDSRQSYKQVASNIKSKKEIVAYHIQKMVDEGIITKFVPVFALSKARIFSSKMYIQLHGLNAEKEKSFVADLLKDNNVVWVAKSIGKWDLLVGFYTHDIIDFEQKKNALLAKYNDYIKSYDITQIANGLVFGRDYFVTKSIAYRNHFVFAGSLEHLTLDKIDIAFLEEVRNNARFQLVDVAQKLGVDARTVLARQKSLEKKGFLQGYTVFLDTNKIGIHFHKLCIHLSKYNEEQNALIEYLKSNPNILHLIQALGSWELEIECEYENAQGVYVLIKELKNTFPELIKQIDLVTITEELKLEFFPDKSFFS